MSGSSPSTVSLSSGVASRGQMRKSAGYLLPHAVQRLLSSCASPGKVGMRGAPIGPESGAGSSSAGAGAGSVFDTAIGTGGVPTIPDSGGGFGLGGGTGGGPSGL